MNSKQFKADSRSPGFEERSPSNAIFTNQSDYWRGHPYETLLCTKLLYECLFEILKGVILLVVDVIKAG